jgi:hypothetical protein
MFYNIGIYKSSSDHCSDNNFMPKKLIKLNLLVFLLLPILVVFLLLPHNLQAASTDAIAIRIVPNPNHYSVLHWYGNQGFTGSPQATIIDGYAAIRDGRTAYVNVANIKDNNISTDILIISYNQDSEIMTVDIFGQLVKNLKFNTNITGSGVCSVSSSLNCVYSSDCPSGEYCSSQKSKIIRDVKRLEDLAEIKSRLDVYKLKNNFYPVLASGTYVAGTSLSTWPSWQQTLAVDLGFTLPVDPINKLGTCPNNYDATTCWDAKTFLFAKDLTKYELPDNSHVYLYQSHNEGASITVCTQTESDYSNLIPINCFTNNKNNQAPIIKAASLVGTPNMEFNGYVSISDPDNNPLTLKVALIPLSDGAIWTTSKGWQFSLGLTTFSVLPTYDANQKKIYAPKTGSYNKTPGYYSVKLTVDDGQGAPNSIASGTYPITLKQVPAYLNNALATVAIGHNFTLSMTGTDINGDPFTTVDFKDANLDFNNTNFAQSSTLSSNHGFTLSGINLSETFKSSQHTGTYTVNVCGHNPGQPTTCIPASFTYIITNRPPVFSKLTANFQNGSSQTCTNSSGNCTVAIDNGEHATVVIDGSDPDSHAVSYSLVDNFGGKLTIDPVTGKITGLENLNFKGLTDATSTITVKMSDSYCANSKPEECSSTYSFKLLVKAYCSLDVPESIKQITLFPTGTPSAVISTSGQTLNIGNLDCSAIGSSTADVRFNGSNDAAPDHDRAIVLANDVSNSMGTDVTLAGVKKTALDWLIGALINKDGFLDQLHTKALEIGSRGSSTIFYDDFSFSKGVKERKLDNYEDANFLPPQYFSMEPLINLNDGLDNSKSRKLQIKKDDINSYLKRTSTDTLRAFNYAELKFNTITNPQTEKILILISDGLPAIPTYECKASCLEHTCECNQGTWTPPDGAGCTYTPPVCSYGESYLNCDDKCYKLTCNTEYCTGVWPQCDCHYPDTGPGTSPYSYNNLFNFKNLFGRLFNIPAAQAITKQTECPDTPAPTEESLNCPSLNNPSLGNYYYYFINTVQPCVVTTYTCNTKNNIDTQVQALKAAGITIYTIYYNTQNTDAPAQNMCDWSSNNGVNCDGGGYAFSGSNIGDLVNSVTVKLMMTKPTAAKVNGFSIDDTGPTEVVSDNPNTSILGLVCGNNNPVIRFDNQGSLEFSNLKINYCPVKLRP